LKCLLRRMFAALVFATTAVLSYSASFAEVRVILVGTGGPEFSPTRQGYSILVEAGDQLFLFDAGRGVAQGLYHARINPKSISKIFFTHLHNDHIEGLPTLWITPWFLLARDHGLEVWGPPGTGRMIAGMRQMFSDVEKRGNVNGFNKPEYMDIAASEIDDGFVYDNKGVKITAFSVEHGDGNPALGYRIDAEGRTIVLSGDTVYHPHVVEQGRAADVIVHNVVAFSDRWMARPEMQKQMQSVLAKLASPDQAAKVFSETRPRLAAYSHVVKKDLSGDEGDGVILERTRAGGYLGPLVMGKDGMIIDVADVIRVIQPQTSTNLPDLDNRAVVLKPEWKCEAQKHYVCEAEHDKMSCECRM
jgi:ribonuclease Z